MATTRDVLDISSFDPMGLDITYINETIQQIPEDGYIDINNAERLATKFLRCADYTADLLSKAFHYYGQRSTEQRAAKSSAIYRKIREDKVTPTVAKEAYADDSNYIRASNEEVTAEALTKWLEEKYHNLIKAHILCKTILTRYMPGERASSWQGSEDDKDYEAKDTPSSSKFATTRSPLAVNRGAGMRVGYVEGFD